MGNEQSEILSHIQCDSSWTGCRLCVFTAQHYIPVCVSILSHRAAVITESLLWTHQHEPVRENLQLTKSKLMLWDKSLKTTTMLGGGIEGQREASVQDISSPINNGRKLFRQHQLINSCAIHKRKCWVTNGSRAWKLPGLQNSFFFNLQAILL